jgi:hypothetical protein
MARIRSIKPEFWTDSAVVRCSPLARLLFIGIWNHADDYGIVKDDPSQLRRQVLPEDDVEGTALVDELVRETLLVRGMAETGTPVLMVRSWEVHQRVDSRSPGRYGTPDSITLAGCEVSSGGRIPTDPARSQPIPHDPNRSTAGREGKGEETTSGIPSPEERREDVDGLCDLLVELIEANGCRRPSITRRWRTEARLLLDKDGVPIEDASKVMRWALADSFWKSNILSLPKFREKYDQLKLRALVAPNGRPMAKEEAPW